MTGDAFNLGPRERLKRRMLGKVALACAAGLIIAFLAAGAPRWARLVVFIPLWLAALGFGQAKERICIALAARGACNFDGAETKLADEPRAASIRKKARAIHRRAVLIASLGTLVLFAAPPY